MRYLEILEAKQPDFSNGKFVAFTLSDETKANLANFANTHQIINPADPKEYHITLVYSKADFPWTVMDTLEDPIVVEPAALFWEVFKTESGSNCLVLRMEHPALLARHKQAMEAGATNDFPDYKSHITISYDIGEVQIETIPIPDFEIEIIGEYEDPLKP